MLKPHHRLAIVVAIALSVAPTIARGQSGVRNPPLPRPAPYGLKAAPLPQATPALPAATPQPTAASGLKPLNMVRNAPEELGQVPDHFFWLRRGLQAVQDPVDGDLVFINDDGRIVGRATLPPGFDIGRVVMDDGQIRLLDTSGRLQVTIIRNIDARHVRSLQALPVMAAGRRFEVRRAGSDHWILREPGRNTSSLDVRSRAGGRLAQAYPVGLIGGDRRYVVSEEIVATAPSLKVHVFVQRFDRAGRVTGLAYIPLDGFEVVPHDFITLTDRGMVRVLVPTATGVKIREYGFTQPPPGRGRLSDTELKRMSRAIRQLNVETNLLHDKRIRPLRKGGLRFKVAPPTPSIARDKIILNAKAYLTVDWVMGRANFSNPSVANRCSPRQADFWRRPSRLTSALVGKTIGPMPYRWGGDDTPQTFKVRIEWGALAGDVCTCRDPALDYCLSPQSAGVDCSGFVSRAWGIGKRGTAGLLDVADSLKSIADLKPGDAFDWPGHHVRLFVGMSPGAEIGFTVLEASTRSDCEGVCQRAYRPSEMNGYQLIRYKGVSG